MEAEKVVVFGASSGIGLASARLLADRGYTVTAVGRNQGKLKQAAVETSVQCAVVDAGSEHEVKRLFAEQGAIDHVVLTLSGSKGGGPFSSLSLSQLREGFEEKFFLHWRVAQAALPTLSPHGSLTFVDAISARAAIPETAGLAAINGALDAMIKPLARELKPRRVNAVAPGLIETHWWDSIPEPERKKVFAATAAATPIGRNGHAEEVAQAIAFLVTNNYVNGTTIEVDGGLHVA